MGSWHHKLPAKYSGVLDRPVYKALRKSVKRMMDQLEADYGYVSISPGHFMSVKVGDRTVGLSDKTVMAVWDKIASDLGLIDDGTGTNTWTVRGKELPEINALREYARRTGKVR